MIEKKDIEKLIITKKKNNLINHWKDAFITNTTKYSGEVLENEILLWRSSRHLRGAYPIFRISFHKNEKIKGIKTEDNPFYKLNKKIILIILILISLALFSLDEIRQTLIAITIISIIVASLYILLTKKKKFETKYLIEELQETIENIEQTKNPNKIVQKKKKPQTKEWTLSKILARLLLYPFCGIIIWACIYFFIPDGRIGKAIFGIGIALIYPITDILLILKKKPPIEK